MKITRKQRDEYSNKIYQESLKENEDIIRGWWNKIIYKEYYIVKYYYCRNRNFNTFNMEIEDLRIIYANLKKERAWFNLKK